MANYRKYYIAVRLLLLKQYLEANPGRSRIVKRRELEQLLEEHDMKVEKKTFRVQAVRTDNSSSA